MVYFVLILNVAEIIYVFVGILKYNFYVMVETVADFSGVLIFGLRFQCE